MRTLQSPPPGLFYYINKHPPPRLPFGIKITSFHSFFGEARESCICLFPGIKETWQMNSPRRRNTLLLRSLPGPRVFITGRISSVFHSPSCFFLLLFFGMLVHWESHSREEQQSSLWYSLLEELWIFSIKSPGRPQCREESEGDAHPLFGVSSKESTSVLTCHVSLWRPTGAM